MKCEISQRISNNHLATALIFLPAGNVTCDVNVIMHKAITRLALRNALLLQVELENFDLLQSLKM